MVEGRRPPASRDLGLEIQQCEQELRDLTSRCRPPSRPSSSVGRLVYFSWQPQSSLVQVRNLFRLAPLASPSPGIGSFPR